MKFIVWSPDGIPIQEKPFTSRLEANCGIEEFVARFKSQGYYAGVEGRISLDEISGRCRVEEVSEEGEKQETQR